MPPAASKDAACEEMSADGLSDSWLANKSNQVRVVNRGFYTTSPALTLSAQQRGAHRGTLCQRRLRRAATSTGGSRRS